MNFSVISYLSGEEYKRVRALQKELSKLTGSRACLEDWQPHITIGDGIRVAEEALPEVEKQFQKFASQQNAISASTSGFGGIENWEGSVEGNITPYVLWLNVEVTPELIALHSSLRDSIIAKHETWLPRTVNFSPHITLSFADLKEEGYRKGKDYLSTQTFEMNICISSVSLAECYGPGNMTSSHYRTYYFRD